MTRLLFFIASFFIIAAMVSCCLVLRRRDSELKSSLFNVDCAGTVVFILQLLTLFDFGEKVSLFFSGLYYASVHWLLIFFVDYLFVFTQTPFKSKNLVVFRNIWAVALIFDSLSLLTNVFSGLAFSIVPFAPNGKFFCWNYQYHLGFFIHLAFCYFLVALIFYLFIRKITMTKKFYRSSYLSMFLVFLLVIVLNAFWLSLDDNFDISVFLYGAFAVLATYYSFYSQPRKVEEKILGLVTENMSNGVLCFDLNKKCIYANKSAGNFFEEKSDAEKELLAFIEEKKEFAFRDKEIFKDGKKTCLSEEFYILRDSNQLVVGYFIFIEDITKELNLVNREKYRSTHDLLTGVYNRSNFFLECEKLLKKQPDIPRYLVCTDIVNFKLVNDLFGLSNGDALLKKEVEVLQENCLGDSILGRISGDRFALLIRKEFFSPSEFSEKIEEITRFLDEYNYKIQFKIGVYEISDPYESANFMFDKANLAIQKNSELEKTLTFYSASLMENLVEEKNVVTSFAQALKKNQFEMYLQPQVSSISGEIAGAEALVRWIHPEKGVLSPGSFVPVLEKAGLLYKLDCFIWEAAAKKLSEWKKRDIPMHIAVNISVKDFYHLDLYKVFTGLVEKYGIEPEKLKLEITETVFMHDINLHMQVLSRLQNYGFSIEMDDFGSGYSSLNMLRNIAVDILKIDMFFLKEPKNSEKSRLILSKIIKMAKKLKMTVISEGVEDEESAEFLRNAGCDYFQGYLYSKPVTVSAFEKNFIRAENGEI